MSIAHLPDQPVAQGPDQPFRPRRLGPEPSPGGIGAVVVHGFTGSPWDMLPVAEAVAAQGIAVRVPCLTGHDEGWRGVARARLSDWRRDVELEARALHEATGRPVLMVGLSMGGLLSLDLAQRGVVPVAGIGALAVPLDLGPAVRKVSAWMKAHSPAWDERLYWPKIGGPDLQNRQRLPGPERMPLRAVAELNDLVESVRGRLDAVTSPLLVVHARRDHTAPVAGASLLARSVSSPWVRLVLLREGFHVITRDVTEERVAAEVATFAEHLAAGLHDGSTRAPGAYAFE